MREGIDVAAMAQQCLQNNPYQQIKRIKVVFEAGKLKLRGTVSTYYFKQMAQQAVLGLGLSVENEVAVANVACVS